MSRIQASLFEVNALSTSREQETDFKQTNNIQRLFRNKHKRCRLICHRSLQEETRAVSSEDETQAGLS